MVYLRRSICAVERAEDLIEGVGAAAPAPSAPRQAAVDGQAASAVAVQIEGQLIARLTTEIARRKAVAEGP